jgi:molybdopterin converting factor small subunit
MLGSENSKSVKFRFIGAFKKAYGGSEAIVKIAATEKLGSIVKKITKNSTDLKRLLIDPELNSPLPNAVILVNGRDIHLLNGLQTDLAGGDEVILIPVIHGG